MLLLSQAPNGAISARRCSLTSPLPPFPKSNHPPLFSKCKPHFPHRNPRKKLSLTLGSAAAADEGPTTTTTTTRPVSGPFPPDCSEETIFVGEDGIPLEGVIQFDRPGPPSRLDSWGRVALLAGGDVLFLLLFSAIGRFSHGFPVVDVETVRTADPFIAGWFLAAYFLGGYGDDGKGMNGPGKATLAAAKSWAGGIPLGLVIRMVTSGHIPPVPFILVSMGSTAVLLIGWRSLLHRFLPSKQNKKNDVYRRGSPFELFELLTSLVRRW